MILDHQRIPRQTLQWGFQGLREVQVVHVETGGCELNQGQGQCTIDQELADPAAYRRRQTIRV